ncbi:hypothetical protein DXG01_005664 [Tephrocybe rancida]|nr:hypothetical protein DXG01_005664 [Tephrocybe rancida]
MAMEIPVNPDSYKKWLQSMQEQLDRTLKTRDDIANGFDYMEESDSPPQLDRFIQWTYEVDLDNEVFLVNNWPVFNLRNVPHDRRTFVLSIGRDSYGNSGYDASTPEVHRFLSWKVPTSTFDQTNIARYNSQNVRRQDVPGEEIADISTIKQSLLGLRIRFLEVLIGAAMKGSYYSNVMNRAGCFSNYLDFPDILAELGYFLADCAANPCICDDWSPRKATGVFQLSSKIYFRLATHLADNDALQATVAEILDFMKHNPETAGVIYGVAFSFVHCVIIRVDMEDWTVDHTSALQFLPSFYGNSPSTPGISALARIGCLADPLIEFDVAFPKENELVKDFPIEIWSQVAEYLLTNTEFKAMAHICPLSWSVANTQLKYPFLDPYRLKSLQKEVLDPNANFGLWTARFKADSDKGTELVYLWPREHAGFKRSRQPLLGVCRAR